MATNTRATDIFDGDRKNRKQGVRVIPAKAEANKPGVIDLQSVSGTTVTDRYLWHTSAGVLRTGSTFPTTPDSDGAAVGTAGGATTTLNNIASVAIPVSLISDTKNTDDLGSAAIYWKDLFIGGDIYCQEAGAGTFDVKLAFTAPTADYTYTFPNAGAAADVMLDTGAANVIAYTKGTSTINFGANADLDIAAGKTVNIDNAVTIQGDFTVSATCTLDQNLAIASSPTFVAVTTQGITNTTTVIDTTANIQLGADNVKVTFGTADATDSYMQFNGNDLEFYDSNHGVARTLTELYTGTTLNPTVSGNLSIADGDFDWTNTSAAETALWTLAATTVDGIQIASSNTSADVLQITANATNSGNLISLNATDATITSGAYIYCYDGAAQDFAVRRYGATTIAGSAAGTAALTLTTGDIKVTSGFLDLDSPVGTGGHNIATADDGTSASPFITITNSNVAFDQAMILLDSNATGAYDAMQITHDGTGSPLRITTTAVTATQLVLAGPAAQTTAAFYYSGDYDGATDVGVIDITSTGTHVHANTSLLYLDHNTGAPAASARGSILRINDTTANAADAWVAYIGTTNNDGLLITTGAVADINLKLTGIQAQTSSMAVIDGSTGTGWEGGAATGMLHLNAIGARADVASSLLLISDVTGASPAAGRGTSLAIVDTTTVGADSFVAYINTTANDGLLINTGHADGVNVKLTGLQAQVGQMLHVNGATGTGWDGADDTGCVHINTLVQNHTGATALFIDHAAAPIASGQGVCARFIQSAGAATTTAYLVEIAPITTGGALNVPTGVSNFVELVTCSGGIVTKVGDVDIHDTVPTAANCISNFGATQPQGFIGVMDDAGAGANVWLVTSDGTDYFYAAKLTKAV